MPCNILLGKNIKKGLDLRLRMKRKVQALMVFLLTSALLLSVHVYAEDIENLEAKTSNLQNQLNSINQDLLKIADEIASTEATIEETNNDMLRIQDSLAISRENEMRQYEDMKTRIRYMYENGSNTLLELLFSAENMTDFLNRADFIQNISSYDREKLENLQSIQKGIEIQEADLLAKQNSLKSLQEQLVKQQEELKQKAQETSTDLEAFKAQLQALREEQARAAAEAARRAEEERKRQVEIQMAQTNTTVSDGASTSTGSTNPADTTLPSDPDSVETNSGADSSIGETTSYPTYNTGALTPSKGVVYYNGHRETYYSQKVLPGGGLSIPGRHVAEDGTIRDSDGYICVASSDLAWGTVVETSLGAAKVYDSGCASGTIDIYTDW